jgi:predicted O-methyltransferase YrrM
VTSNELAGRATASLEPFQRWAKLVVDLEDPGHVAVDRAHNVFLMGALLSRKPRDILELGVGSGFVTRTLLEGVRFNGVGRVTAVDSWADWSGSEPPVIGELRAAGVNVVAPVTEETFVHEAPDDGFDFLVSDADHRRSGTWIDEHLRIIRHDGFMFFHDTNHESRFKALGLIEKRIRELGLPSYHFTESTLPDERCDRGWLFAINKKGPDVPRRRRTRIGRLLERWTV